MRHLKKFKIVDDYFTFKDSTDYLLPNVSYTKKGKKVFFQGVPPPPIIKAEFNATADNLTAITRTSNIKKLKVDGVNIPISPIVTTSSEIEILAKDVILVGDGSGSIPESTFYNGTPTSWALRPSDSSVNVTDEGYYIGILISINGMTDIMDTYPVNLFLEEGDGIYDELTNTINLNLDADFGEYLAEITAMGAKITMMFVNLDENTGTITPIDTVNMCFGQTGGLPGPYVFDTEGYHTIEAEISDKTVISTSMFAGTCITSIELPDSVTSIGEEAFNDCSGLTGELIIPDSVTSIGDYAFYNCSGLTSVIIPDSVTSIGEGAFYICSGLTSLEIGSGVTSIGDYTFHSCSGLTSVIIPDSVTSIGDNAFYRCERLTSVVIPDSVTSIGAYAFQYCSGLANVEFGSGVTSIGERAFEFCSGLESIVVLSGNTIYDSRENCNCIIETSTNSLIQGCKNSFIPDSITSIGNYAFSDCKGLTSIVIPDSITSIGQNAFNQCSGLTSVEIGSGVTSIGDWTFGFCSGLTEITCHAVTAPSIQSYTFYDVSTLGKLIYPEGSDYSSWLSTNSYYLGYSNWFAYEIEVELPEFELDGYDVAMLVQPATTGSTKICHTTSNIAEIKVNDTVLSSISTGYTFSEVGKWNVVRIKYTDGVTSIPSSGFSSCARMFDVKIADSVTSIGRSAFFVCSGLTSLEIGSGVTSIGELAFNGCSALELIVVSTGNTAYDCRENCNCIIKTATNILIAGCNNSFIPNSVTSIGSYAFNSRYGLTGELVIPDSVTSIGSGAFNTCKGLTGELVIPDSVTSIGDNVFAGCKGLTGLKIGSGVTSINMGTFQGCSSLISIEIGSGVTSIGDYAFHNCFGLKEIVCWAKTAPSIQSKTFQYVKTNGTLYIPSGSNYSSWMSTGNYYLGKYNWTTQTIAS